MNNLISKLGLISKTSGCDEWISGVKYPIEALFWIGGIESAESVATCYHQGKSCRHTSRLLIVKFASGLKKIINGDCKRRDFIQEEAAQKEMFFITRRQGVDDLWVLQGQRHRRIRLGLQWKFAGRLDAWHHSVVQYASGWIHNAMRKQPHEEFLDNWNYRQLQQNSWSHCCLCTVETVQIRWIARLDQS